MQASYVSQAVTFTQSANDWRAPRVDASHAAVHVLAELTHSKKTKSLQIWKHRSRPSSQSAGQSSALSLPSHVLSPQTGGQSPGQLARVSAPLHVPSPQSGPAAQSAGQLVAVSVPLHAPSPQTGPVEQSLGQLAGTSLQTPSPQRAGIPQSAVHCSPGSHRPSPQLVQG